MTKNKSASKPIQYDYPEDVLIRSSVTSEPIVILVDEHQCIRDMNQPGIDVFAGKNPNQLLGSSVVDLFNEHQLCNEALLAALASTSQLASSNFILEHKAQQELYSVTVISLIQGKVVHHIISMQALHADYFELKSYVNAIIDNLPGAVYWKDRDGRYLGCNKFVANMAGFNSPEEIVGKTDYDLCWSEFADDWRMLDSMVMQEGALIEREEKAKLADGNIITELTVKTPLRNQQGEIIGVIGNSLDISERKEMEAALRESQIAANAASEAKSVFISNMSHDICTPLSGVVGMSQLLMDSLPDPEMKQLAQWLNESGNQLLSLLNGILDMASAEKIAENDLYLKTFDLRQCVQDLFQLQRPASELKGLYLQLHLDDSIPQFIIGDRTKLHRILLNLLSNAIKFTQTGGVRLEIRKLAQTADTVKIEFRLTDTGIGIPKEHQDKVFERFHRITPSYKGTYQGHGVGLHIAKSFVSLLGGDLQLESEPGDGTKFHFSLLFPIGIAEQSGEDAQAIKTAEAIAHNASTDAFHVLLVEDNHIALMIAQKMVENAHCRHTSAKDGKQGLELAKATSFDLIITDIGLPFLTGLEMTKQIRAWEKEQQLKPVPIVGLTAQGSYLERDKGVQAGMNEVFCKPIDLPLMHNILSRFVLMKNQTVAETPISYTSNAKKHLQLDDPTLDLSKFPVFDPKDALRILNGNKRLLLDQLDLLLNEYMPIEIPLIQQAHMQKDWDKIADLAHKMKGGLMCLGTIKLKYACQFLEQAKKNGHPHMLESLYSQIISVAIETEEAIREWQKVN